MKTASVIITTKNRKEELLKAVESAMGQRGLLEVIVIDDGSTDGTAEAVLRYAKEMEDRRSKIGKEQGAGLTTDCSDGHGWGTTKSTNLHEMEDAGQRLASQAGAVFSNPFTSELARDSENPSLTRSADNPASSHATAPEAQALDSGRSTLDPQTAAKPQLRLIRQEVSAGYIVRRNEGGQVARGDVIFSLDDDAVFSSPFVVEQTLRDFSHPRIGAVAIPYIEPHKANREMQRAPTGEDIWITASYIGTAHAVRRDVFLALGGYREHLVHQGEEGDFCLRMLAAEQPINDSGGLRTDEKDEKLKAKSGNAEKLKTELTTFERLGGREKEQPKVGPKGEGVGTTESNDSDKHGWGTTKDTNLHESRDAGPCLDKPSGAAFSNPSTSELARDSENTSLTRSASGPASSPATSYPLRATAPTGAPATRHSLPVTAPEAPGFFVRLGNSGVIIHNESPKRDYSRMDFYGRRNDVLFHWQNTPMPDLLWQLPKTIAGGLVCAAKVGRWRKMLEGVGAGFLAIAGGVQREPVSINAISFSKKIKNKCIQINII